MKEFQDRRKQGNFITVSRFFQATNNEHVGNRELKMIQTSR